MFDEIEFASVSYKELASFDVQTHSLAELIQEYNTKPPIPVCKHFKCENGKPKFYSREFLGHCSPKNARQGLGGHCVFCKHALFWTRKYDDLDDDQTEARYKATIESRIKAVSRKRNLNSQNYERRLAGLS